MAVTTQQLSSGTVLNLLYKKFIFEVLEGQYLSKTFAFVLLVSKRLIDPQLEFKLIPCLFNQGLSLTLATIFVFMVSFISSLIFSLFSRIGFYVLFHMCFGQYSKWQFFCHYFSLFFVLQNYSSEILNIISYEWLVLPDELNSIHNLIPIQTTDWISLRNTYFTATFSFFLNLLSS